jgi:membrane-associated phospholipid phosphatase
MTDSGAHFTRSSTASLDGGSAIRANAPQWRYFFREAAWVTFLWLIVYGGANWFTSLHTYRVRLWTRADLAIPFVPIAALVYLSVFPMLWLAPLVLRGRVALHSFAKSLGWLIVVSGIAFLLLPGEHVYPGHAPTGLAGAIYRFADGLNMTHNFLPSLHVGMATTCAYAYGCALSRRKALVFWIWAAAIAASTLLIHDHYLADVVTGGLLGLFVANNCGRANGRPNAR